MKLQEKTILNGNEKKKRKNPILEEKINEGSKTLLMLKVEERVGRSIRAFLIHCYIDERLSWNKVAKIAKVSQKSVRSWGKIYGIKSRSMSDAAKLFVKKNHYLLKKYNHISICLCQKCGEISDECGFEHHHEKGYCIFNCVNYRNEAY